MGTRVRRLIATLSTIVSSVNLETFEALPSHERRCTFWTMDPAAAETSGRLSDPEFEKEAWLSILLLEWGTCGQIARDTGTTVGCAMYAPPGDVPRSRTFPTSPVSPDAVLLTTMWVQESSPGTIEDVRAMLMRAVVADLVNRGVRAIESFGLRRRDGDPERRHPTDDCSECTCMIDADFLEKAGFEVVAEHSRYPRLRLELDRDHGWKQDVEAALESLLAAAVLTMSGVGAPGGEKERTLAPC